MRGESGLHIHQGKEAYITPGSGILAATSEDGREGDRRPQMLQDVWQRSMGHKLPLEPIRLVSKLPLELSLPG